MVYATAVEDRFAARIESSSSRVDFPEARMEFASASFHACYGSGNSSGTGGRRPTAYRDVE
jgi:hypothetical protein